MPTAGKMLVQGVVTMPKLCVLSSQGDTLIEWDTPQVERGDPDALAAVREAERLFAEQRARGATAFVVAPNRQAERIEVFDPLAEQVVMVPRVAGG